MSDVTERCPWCESVISRSKFLKIEETIREQEQAKLAEAERQLRAELDAQHIAEITKQKHIIEATATAEAAKQIAAVNAERDRLTERLSQVRIEAEKQATEQVLKATIERDHVIQEKQLLQDNVDLIRKQAEINAAQLATEFNSQRDELQRRLTDAEAREAMIRMSVQEQIDSALKIKIQNLDNQRQNELADQRSSLEKDRDNSLLKVQADFNRERESLQNKLKDMERQLLKKTAQDLGEGAEIDLYEALREAFPDDRITRVPKGLPGADIHHEVMYKGQGCGKIVIDSKNRQAWQNGFVSKLRQDQTDAGAEHAVLASTVFPSGKKELCVESDIIVVNPARVKHVISLLRRTMITIHVRGLSVNERATKMSKLYKLITSESYAQRFGELEKLTNDVLELDVQEKKAHDNVWRKRGAYATRMNNVLREIDTEVAAVVEGHENTELSVAS